MMLKDYSTKALIEELLDRQGVEACWVEPEWQYEVAVLKNEAGPNRYLKGGMHLGDNKGPAWIVVVTD